MDNEAVHNQVISAGVDDVHVLIHASLQRCAANVLGTA